MPYIHLIIKMAVTEYETNYLISQRLVPKHKPVITMQAHDLLLAMIEMVASLFRPGEYMSAKSTN